MGDTITEWNFEQTDLTPNIGSGLATNVGGTSSAFASGNSSLQGWQTSSYPGQFTNSGSAGVAFFVSTVGYSNLALRFDHRASGTASRWARVDYTTNGGVAWVPFWTNGGGLSPHDTFYSFTNISFASVAGANNNSGFGIRIVSIFSPVTFTDEFAGVQGPNTAYHRARISGGSAYSPSGTWRFDNVRFTGDPISPSPPLYATNSAILINEILVNPIGTDDSREYVEIKGPPGTPLQGLSILEISGNGTNIGKIFWARDLSGSSLGSNGLLLIGEMYQSFWPAWTGVPPATALMDMNHPRGRLDNDTTTFLLVTNFTGSVDQDLDTNDDGTFDVTPFTQILDSVGWLDGSVGDRVYTPASLTQSSGTPDAATRVATNINPHSFAAWFNGDLMTNASDSAGITYNPFRGSVIMPAGAKITPGQTNHWNTDRQPPLIAPIPDRVVKVSNTVVMTVQALATDGDPVTLALQSGPSGATFGSTGTVGTLTWFATPTGVYAVIFTATDVDGTSTAQVQIIVQTAAVATIRITEVMSKSSHPADRDWFEIYNYGDSPVDLTGISWDDDSNIPGSGHFNGYVIPPGGTYVISARPAGTESIFLQEWGLPSNAPVWCAGPAVFQNFSSAGDALYIYDQYGLEITSVVIPPATIGYSFEWAGDGSNLGLSVAGENGAYIAPDNGEGSPGTDVASPGYALPVHPTNDSDGDGQTDLEEWIAGTDPNSASSAFLWTAHSAGIASVGLVSGRWYEVQSTTNLITGPWLSVTNFVAPSNMVWITGPGTNGMELRRIRVKRP
ncbi:MAG: lamin tail domain-containing protein [Kiritimatiellae bacterium]|nr:lamin tail domain-containing protein [Kiritimatiellia bacterium]MDW8459204.1 lamin tail domain-containing protein [Verrucomicrobiota bacterium]